MTRYTFLSSFEYEDKLKSILLDEIYRKAEKHLLRSAYNGDPLAQTELGIMYKYGYGTIPDANEAVLWLERAANQSFAPAQFWLGTMYDKDDEESYGGVTKSSDYKEAFQWYKAAAEQGHARAQAYLGYAYENGLGVEADLEEAESWYRKAKEQGDDRVSERLSEVIEKKEKAESEARMREEKRRRQVQELYKLRCEQAEKQREQQEREYEAKKCYIRNRGWCGPHPFDIVWCRVMDDSDRASLGLQEGAILLAVNSNWKLVKNGRCALTNRYGLCYQHDATIRDVRYVPNNTDGRFNYFITINNMWLSVISDVKDLEGGRGNYLIL